MTILYLLDRFKGSIQKGLISCTFEFSVKAVNVQSRFTNQPHTLF